MVGIFKLLPLGLKSKIEVNNRKDSKNTKRRQWRQLGQRRSPTSTVEVVSSNVNPPLHSKELEPNPHRLDLESPKANYQNRASNQQGKTTLLTKDVPSTTVSAARCPTKIATTVRENSLGNRKTVTPPNPISNSNNHNTSNNHNHHSKKKQSSVLFKPLNHLGNRQRRRKHMRELRSPISSLYSRQKVHSSTRTPSETELCHKKEYRDQTNKFWHSFSSKVLMGMTKRSNTTQRALLDSGYGMAQPDHRQKKKKKERKSKRENDAFLIGMDISFDTNAWLLEEESQLPDPQGWTRIESNTPHLHSKIETHGTFLLGDRSMEKDDDDDDDDDESDSDDSVFSNFVGMFLDSASAHDTALEAMERQILERMERDCNDEDVIEIIFSPETSSDMQSCLFPPLFFTADTDSNNDERELEIVFSSDSVLDEESSTSISKYTDCRSTNSTLTPLPLEWMIPEHLDQSPGLACLDDALPPTSHLLPTGKCSHMATELDFLVDTSAQTVLT